MGMMPQMMGALAHVFACLGGSGQNICALSLYIRHAIFCKGVFSGCMFFPTFMPVDKLRLFKAVVFQTLHFYDCWKEGILQKEHGT